MRIKTAHRRYPLLLTGGGSDVPWYDTEVSPRACAASALAPSIITTIITIISIIIITSSSLFFFHLPPCSLLPRSAYLGYCRVRRMDIIVIELFIRLPAGEEVGRGIPRYLSGYRTYRYIGGPQSRKVFKFGCGGVRYRDHNMMLFVRFVLSLYCIRSTARGAC